MNAQFKTDNAQSFPEYASIAGANESVSELERLQFRHDFFQWTPYLAVAVGIAFYFLADSFDDWICGFLISLAAGLPFALWAKRLVIGLPMLPVVSAMYLVFYGLPFVTGHPFTKNYSFEEKLTATATIVTVLLSATLVWAGLGQARPLSTLRIRVVPKIGATRIFVVGLGLACLFQINAFFWLVPLSSEVFGILRAILQSLGMISVFALGYQFGGGKLDQSRIIVFVVGLASYTFLNIMSLYLITAMEIILLSAIGMFLGGGKVPWKLFVVGVFGLAVLSAGKSDIRSKYWTEDVGGISSISDAGSMVVEWVGFGIENFFGASQANDPEASLLNRASLTHLVLFVETQTPEFVSYLDGATYYAIPKLIVPRIVWPERPTTQDTLRQLSEHYGLLSIEESETTSIGWGLIAEAYANFGMFGCIGLGLVIGAVLGYAQRWCGRAPVLSARGFFGLLLIMVMLRVETNAAQTLTAWVQSLVPLTLLSILIMNEEEVQL